jgi:regulator of replication initiation timing
MVHVKYACVALALCGVMAFHSTAQAQPQIPGLPQPPGGGVGNILKNLLGISDLEDAISDLEDAVADLEQKADDLQERVGELEDQNDVQAQINADLQAQITAKADAALIAQLQARLDALEQTTTGLCEEAGFTVCNGACVNTDTNNNHCGECGNACGPNMTCENGQCVCVDDPDHGCHIFVQTNNSCVAVNVNQGGACGDQGPDGCLQGGVCDNGSCLGAQPNNDACGSGERCTSQGECVPV